jgi:hypothetical protein
MNNTRISTSDPRSLVIESIIVCVASGQGKTYMDSMADHQDISQRE